VRLDTWTLPICYENKADNGMEMYSRALLLQESHAVGKASASFQFVVLAVLEAGVVTNIRGFIPR